MGVTVTSKRSSLASPMPEFPGAPACPFLVLLDMIIDGSLGKKRKGWLFIKHGLHSKRSVSGQTACEFFQISPLSWPSGTMRLVNPAVRSSHPWGRSLQSLIEGDLHSSLWAVLKFKLLSMANTEHTWACAEMG